MNYGDPHFMIFKDDAFDCTLCAYLETHDEVVSLYLYGIVNCCFY